MTEERRTYIQERIEKIDHLLETEGKEWFARFDCESGTYKQVLDLKEEKEELLKELDMEEEESKEI